MTEFYASGYGIRFAAVTAFFATDILLIYITVRRGIEKRPLSQMLTSGLIALAFITLTTVMAQSHFYSFRTGQWKVEAPLWMLALVWCAGIMYIMFTVASGLRERRSAVTWDTVREAMDNIPAGMCFFDSEGLPSLTNRKMLNLITGLTGSDFQSLDELREVLGGRSDYMQVAFPDGTIYAYSERPLMTESGSEYTGSFLFNITELEEKKQELEKQTESLKKISDQLKYLNENAYKLAREEEVLSFQTRLHDAMGAGITAVHRILEQNLPEDDYADAISVWRRSAEIAYADAEDVRGEGTIGDFASDSAALGVRFELKGNIPDDRDAEDVIMTALRTGLTNCVKHAGATVMCAEITDEDGETVVRITNDGKIPDGEIVPGGGLNNLTERAARIGGSVSTVTDPEFALIVRFPSDREELIP